MSYPFEIGDRVHLTDLSAVGTITEILEYQNDPLYTIVFQKYRATWIVPSETSAPEIYVAQRMYNAYGRVTDHKNFQGLAMPTWEELPAKIKDAWVAAAKMAAMVLEEE